MKLRHKFYQIFYKFLSYYETWAYKEEYEKIAEALDKNDFTSALHVVNSLDLEDINRLKLLMDVRLKELDPNLIIT